MRDWYFSPEQYLAVYYTGSNSGSAPFNRQTCLYAGSVYTVPANQEDHFLKRESDRMKRETKSKLRI